MKRFLYGKKTFSILLNIIGMSIALVTFTAITIQVQYDWGYDDNYPGSDSIYRMELSQSEDNKVYTAHISRPIIENVKEADPNLKAATAFRGIFKGLFTLSKGDQTTYRFTFAVTDNQVTDVFPFKFSEGDPKEYRTSGVCIISQSAAKQLYGKESPVGKSLWVDGSEQRVAAVYKDFPVNCSIPDVIINMGDSQLNDNSEWNMMCYMRLNEGSDTEKVKMSLLSKIAVLYEIDTSSLTEEEIANIQNSVKITKIHDIYFNRFVEDGLPKGNITTTNTLFAISLLIIIIAIINFINFSMASVPFSIKSINTRKVFGSSRGSLVARQMLDSLAITLAAYAISLVILEILSGSVIASYISGSLKPLDNPHIVLLSLIASIAAALLAGLYPALYSTSFQPALVLKGSFSLSAKGRTLRNVMIGFQYVISFILASAALFIIVQTRYMKKYDMGFLSEQVIVATPIGSQEGFRQKMAANPQIKAVTFAGGELVSYGKMGWGRSYNGEHIQLEILPVSPDFIDFFGMQIKEGRGFSQSDELSISGTFIMNESAMARYPSLRIGARLSGHDENNPAEIVGIVKDFNFQPMQYAIKPLALYNFGAHPWWKLNYAYIRIAQGNVMETIQYIRDAIEELNPGINQDNVSVEFLDESIGNMYQKEERLSNIIIMAALLSFIIALIGVLGLVYFETQFRKREIAVKKVYGASVIEILSMFNRRYALLTITSFAVSLPFTYAAIKLWIRDFPYQSPIPLWIFAASLTAILLVTVLTVTLRSYGTATDNPVESLKNE